MPHKTYKDYIGKVATLLFYQLLIPITSQHVFTQPAGLTDNGIKWLQVEFQGNKAKTRVKATLVS